VMIGLALIRGAPAPSGSTSGALRKPGKRSPFGSIIRCRVIVNIAEGFRCFMKSSLP